ncbi:fucolectin-like [Latimeria chalumnae]|uniref:fucolectin-like n=1 Tax=Latimeria chalumnae TaxID=7897 RepID=UPI00313EE87A
MNLVLLLALLCGLFCEGFCFYPGLENVALRGKATQSSVFQGEGFHVGNAINGIDGNHNSNYNLGSCTHTEFENNPWWRVDLLDEYRISRIVITNRGNCCSKRLNGAEIRIGNSLTNNGNDNPKCGAVTLAKQTMEFQCNSMTGRYVNVYLPGINKALHLCEVEVFGALICCSK